MNISLVLSLGAAVIAMECGNIVSEDLRRHLKCVSKSQIQPQPLQATAQPEAQPKQQPAQVAPTGSSENCSCNIPANKQSAVDAHSLKSLRAQIFYNFWPFGPTCWSKNPKALLRSVTELKASPRPKNKILSLLKMQKKSNAHAGIIVNEVMLNDLLLVQQIDVNSLPDQTFIKTVGKSVSSADLKELFKMAKHAYLDEKAPLTAYVNPSKVEEYLNTQKLNGKERQAVKASLEYYSIIFAYFTRQLTFKQAKEAIETSRTSSPASNVSVDINVVQEKKSAQGEMVQQNQKNAHDKAMEELLAEEQSVIGKLLAENEAMAAKIAHLHGVIRAIGTHLENAKVPG